MTNSTDKKEEKEDLKNNYLHKECLANQDNSDEEDIFNSLQSLEDDAARLNEQKANLTALLNQLEDKAKTKVEKRKKEVERLNSEVLDLKRRCEKITLWVNNEQNLECSQAGS
jgi:hypothetical protein